MNLGCAACVGEVGYRQSENVVSAYTTGDTSKRIFYKLHVCDRCGHAEMFNPTVN
jgi:hypothetical protein